MQLTDKIVLLTGGAAGIGRATALLCAQRGAQVIIADLDSSAGAQTAAETKGLFIPVNITDETQVMEMTRQVAETFGRVDVLIHTAGILQGAYVSLDEFNVETFRRVMDVNVTGTFLVVKYLTPLLKKSPKGVLILTSSGAATGGSSSFAYGSSKGGVNGLAVTLTNRLEPEGIRVNVLSPGNIDTGMKRSVIAADVKNRGLDFEKAVSDSKLGTPEGIAKVVAWLASDDADYVRGIITTR
jgi:NAD(P)-dependent dehydrogenase (short-subunit alcohol dehydrogenase family)